jgi:uncharacterized Zn-binding protein involved in type VI secretion
MPGKPAARVGDGIVCPIPQATPAALPHAPPPTGLPIVSPGCLTVLIGGQPAARVGDNSVCVSPVPLPNPILQGAFPVRIGQQPAARLGDTATCPGSMVAPPCCPKVLIGAAGISGNPWAGLEECQKAARNRMPEGMAKNRQSAGNCGVESCRQIMNRVNQSNVGEKELLDKAVDKGLADEGANLLERGGTDSGGQLLILDEAGVMCRFIPTNPANLQAAVASGRGVIAPVMAGTLWAPNTNLKPDVGGHAVLVTGAKYDEQGKLQKIIINDTGASPGCFIEVDADQFLAAMGFFENDDPNDFLVVTKNPIW